MNPPTLVYTPSRRVLWLRVLVREFLIPRTRWQRLIVGPAMIAVGALGVVLTTFWDSGALGLVSGALIGIGLGWASWPLAGAWLAVTRNAAVRARSPIRLVLTSGVVELVRGDDRRLFPLETLERIDTVGGEHWLRFVGGRVAILPATAREGDPAAFLAAVRAYRSSRETAAAV